MSGLVPGSTYAVLRSGSEGLVGLASLLGRSSGFGSAGVDGWSCGVSPAFASAGSGEPDCGGEASAEPFTLWPRVELLLAMPACNARRDLVGGRFW